jgi:nucleotide-binding universal stress UspA family protein
MAIKTILMPLRRSDATPGLLETGPELALRFDAHLDVLYVRPDPGELMPFASMGLTRGLQANLRAAAERNALDEAEGLRTEFEAASTAAGLGLVGPDDRSGSACAAWIEKVGRRDENIARRGRLADLIVVPRPSRVSPPPLSFQAAVLRTGRPVLMVPRERTGAISMDRVAIGWNGSKEVAQAVAAAGPCLASAATVVVLTTPKRMKKHPNGEDLVVYLARHGIESELRVFDPGSKSVAGCLMDEARQADANLLVVGGYSRPRLREVALGGVTRRLFTSAEIPVLMQH